MINNQLLSGFDLEIRRIRKDAKRLRSKRKRHINKWIKNNSESITVYQNASIVSIEEKKHNEPS